MKVVLASGSPRRKELLEKMGIPFVCIPSTKEEKMTDSPSETVKKLSLQKAEDVLWRLPDEEVLVIGSDTVVSYQDMILGKPSSEKEAYEMLSKLQGNSHMVYTGVTLFYKNKQETKVNTFEEHTIVKMYPMSEQEIKKYVATKEPMDKAGAYAVQGKCSVYIQSIQGEYNTIVGFPVARIYYELKQMKLFDKLEEIVGKEND